MNENDGNAMPSIRESIRASRDTTTRFWPAIITVMLSPQVITIGFGIIHADGDLRRSVLDVVAEYLVEWFAIPPVSYVAMLALLFAGVITCWLHRRNVFIAVAVWVAVCMPMWAVIFALGMMAMH